MRTITFYSQQMAGKLVYKIDAAYQRDVYLLLRPAIGVMLIGWLLSAVSLLADSPTLGAVALVLLAFSVSLLLIAALFYVLHLAQEIKRDFSR